MSDFAFQLLREEVRAMKARIAALDEIHRRIAEIEARLAATETRVTDLERRMHISPELMRDLEGGSR